jgi:hypothetical protein
MKAAVSMTRPVNHRTICLALLIAFFLSLLPMIVIARYNHLSTDDFNFGQHTAPAYRETGSFAKTVKAAFYTVRSTYRDWQGTFTAVFFMSLHPAVFNESLYWLVPLFLIALFLSCGRFLLKVILTDRFGADKFQCGIITVIVLALCAHFLPSPVEAFYWWNGGMFYTGFFSLAMLLLALLLKPSLNRRKSAVVLHCAGLMLLSFVIGGGNYVTSLLSIIAAAALLAFRLIHDRKNLRWIVPALCLAALCAAFSISALSPGEMNRQTHFEGLAPVQAVIRSFTEAARFLRIHLLTNVPVLAGLACLIPTLYRIASQSGFSFKAPALVTGFLFGVYAATFTPTLYVMGSSIYPRIHNVSFYSLILFCLVSLLYWCGWLARKTEMRSHPLTRYGAGVLALLFTASSLAVAAGDKNRIAGVSALRSLANGEAKMYHQEALNRRAILLDETITDAVVPRFTAKPHLLYHGELGADAMQIGIARFYVKKSVRLMPLE